MTAAKSPAIDEHGIIQEGPYAGRPLSDVLEYAQTLEQAIAGEGTPPARPPAGQPPTPTPAQRLQNDANNRVDPAQLFTWRQFEEQDLESFLSTVTDYEKYKAKIDKILENMHPMQRAQRGMHKRVYEMVKLEDPEVAARFYAKPEDPPPPPAEGDEPPVTEEPSAAPPAAPPTPQGATPPAPPEPPRRPTPPVSAPTGGRRPPTTPRTPTLKVPAGYEDKVANFARHAGYESAEKYLEELQKGGMTQDRLEDTLTRRTAGTSTARSSVYDRQLKRG